MAKFDDGVNNVTVFDADKLNNINRALKDNIESSGQTIDASNTQSSKALANYVGSANFYTDSGVADAYVLSTTGSFKAPTALVDGLEIRFRTSNSNSGASTINVAGLGVVNIKLGDGTSDISSGFITNGSDIRLRYDALNTAFIPSLVANPYNKNVIINGDFQIAQRGTSFPVAVSGQYALDRFLYAKSGAMVHTITQDTDTPTVAEAGRYIGNSMKIDCTTADASIAAGDYALIETPVEGYNFQIIAQKTNTISFWAKATKTGIYCVSFCNSGTDRSCVVEFTINASNTHEFKTVTIPPSPSAGTWDYTNGIGLRVRFVLAAGSTFQTTAGTWQTGNYYATSNQVNSADSTSNDFRITGVQVEAGSVATEFESRTIQSEIDLCQRYFQKSYNIDVNPGTITIAGVDGGLAINSLNFYDYGIKSSFDIRMRSNPTMVAYNSSTGTAGQIRNASTGATNYASITFTSQKVYQMQVISGQANAAYVWHWTANAEL